MLASIGFGELFIIALLAIVILGPTRGISLIKDVGRLFGKLRKEWKNLEEEVEDTFDEEKK